MIRAAAVTAMIVASPCMAAASGIVGITAVTPWMRYLLPNLPAGGYVTLRNGGDMAVRVTGAASPDCGAMMLHESKDNSGMAMMMDVQSVPVPAHGSVSFAPGGYHIMCTDPKMHVGMDVPVVLSFQGGGTLALSMRVYGATSAP
ncbi:MAG: copper chaperone PCu(A)C [Acidocella sp.]|nr:copper chaperone PCu(A)C [Acidocella sp.]